jgi:hypothetical protein
MKELGQLCRDLKKVPKNNPKLPVRFWSERGEYVIILRTRGCSWALKSGCTMCGYFNESMWREVEAKDLLNQFNIAMREYRGEKCVKIFTSGSFLDEGEINPEVRSKILEELKSVEKISVESRPEFVTKEVLSSIRDFAPIFEIAIGLESANDKVLEKSINKGFTFEDYKRAALLVKEYNFKLKTYVLIKPPFLTERESIEDCICTVKKIADITDIISFNPTTVQRNTVVEYLWKRKEYRPPWLWSVVEILRKSKEIKEEIRCDVVGGGTKRGPHNCGKCDRDFLRAIANAKLDSLHCECKERWLDMLDLEELSFGSVIEW